MVGIFPFVVTKCYVYGDCVQVTQRMLNCHQSCRSKIKDLAHPSTVQINTVTWAAPVTARVENTKSVPAVFFSEKHTGKLGAELPC